MMEWRDMIKAALCSTVVSGTPGTILDQLLTETSAPDHRQ